MTATASLIPGEDNADLPQLASHCTLETFLYSPMPFHSTVESPSAHLGAVHLVANSIGSVFGLRFIALKVRVFTVVFAGSFHTSIDD